MASLQGVSGHPRLDFTPLRYRSSDPGEHGLILGIQAEAAGREWACESACLEDHEVRRLVGALAAWTANPAAKADLEFLEPNVSFRLQAGAVPALKLRIGFSYDAHPSGRQHVGDRFWASFEVSAEAVNAFAAALAEELTRLGRGGDGPPLDLDSETETDLDD